MNKTNLVFVINSIVIPIIKVVIINTHSTKRSKKKFIQHPA
jgi:hypothetical protein